MKPSIIRLRALEKQLYAYLYAMTVIDFDAETVAPEGSADGRAEATEVLSRASFDLLVNDGTAALLNEAAADAETEQERAEVRNLQRQYDEIARIPADEYAAFTKLCSQSVPAWTKAKRTNDFSLFAPYLEKLIAARRAQARYFAPDRDAGACAHLYRGAEGLRQRRTADRCHRARQRVFERRCPRAYLGRREPRCRRAAHPTGRGLDHRAGRGLRDRGESDL